MPKSSCLVLALGLLATAPSLCFACDASTTQSSPSKPLETKENPPLTLSDQANTPMSLEDLGNVSAGAATPDNVISRQQLTAVNSGNSVNAASVTTGTISLDGSALSGYNGVGNFVMNTGNNNNLQGSLSVNISGVAAK